MKKFIPLTAETFKVYDAEQLFDDLGFKVAEIVHRTGFTWEQVSEAIGGVPEDGRNYYLSLTRIRQGLAP